MPSLTEHSSFSIRSLLINVSYLIPAPPVYHQRKYLQATCPGFYRIFGACASFIFLRFCFIDSKWRVTVAIHRRVHFSCRLFAHLCTHTHAHTTRYVPTERHICTRDIIRDALRRCENVRAL